MKTTTYYLAVEVISSHSASDLMSDICACSPLIVSVCGIPDPGAEEDTP